MVHGAEHLQQRLHRQPLDAVHGGEKGGDLLPGYVQAKGQLPQVLLPGHDLGGGTDHDGAHRSVEDAIVVEQGRVERLFLRQPTDADEPQGLTLQPLLQSRPHPSGLVVGCYYMVSLVAKQWQHLTLTHQFLGLLVQGVGIENGCQQSVKRTVEGVDNHANGCITV